jgi:hypothetical protein
MRSRPDVFGSPGETSTVHREIEATTSSRLAFCRLCLPALWRTLSVRKALKPGSEGRPSGRIDRVCTVR